MSDSVFLAAFFTGLLAGVHCVGMCGGIVGALSLGGSATGGCGDTASASPRWLLHLAYNLGRIASYTMAGALAGSAGAYSLGLANAPTLRIAFFVVANVLLIGIGFYLMGFSHLLMPLERGGQVVWRYIQPLSRRFLPARSFVQAFPLGLVWGWLPCGLVYGVLPAAFLGGSAAGGALIMLCFGLGTLPNLLLAGLLLARFRALMQRRAVRIMAGLVIIAFGVHGLWGLQNLLR